MLKKNNPTNQLDGKTWTRYSISVWNDIHKSSMEKKMKHPALFPLHLVHRLIKIFSHPGDLVLDPFMGSGSTLLEAGMMGRRGIGLDISRDYIDLFHHRFQNEGDKNLLVSAIHDDARNLLHYVSPLEVDFCLTSPPYWNILGETRSADKKELRNYSNAASSLGYNLGYIEDYQQFLDELSCIFTEVYNALGKGKYCIVVVMDLRKKNQFFPLHMDLAYKMQLIGYTLDDIIIWDRRHEYNNLRPLGFPYVFRVNKVHEYILIFQKR